MREIFFLHQERCFKFLTLGLRELGISLTVARANTRVLFLSLRQKEGEGMDLTEARALISVEAARPSMLEKTKLGSV